MSEIIKNTDIDLSKAIVIDSTLIKTYRSCQKKYDYFQNQHYVSKSRKAAPSFGIAMHEGIAQFREQRKKGTPYPLALEIGQAALQQAYQKHMPPESQSEVMQDDRRSLNNAIRLYIGFCQHYEPLGYKYHQIEVPFALLLGQIEIPNPLANESDPLMKLKKDVIYVGIIDAIIEWQNRLFISDVKSTASNISETYLNGYKMDQGLPGYTLAARELLGVNTNHGLVHAFWVQKEAKVKGKPLDEYYHTKEVYWDNAQLEEWTQNTLQTVQEIEMHQVSGQWQMNFSYSCTAYNSPCDYFGICTLPQEARKQRLEMDFKKAIWTPLEDERLTPMED